MKKAFTLFLLTFICSLMCPCYISHAQSMDSMCTALENAVSMSLAKKGVENSITADTLKKHITDRGDIADVVTIKNDGVDPTMNIPSYVLASVSGLSGADISVDSIIRLSTRNTDEIKSAAQKYGSVIISYCYNGNEEENGVYVSGKGKGDANRYAIITGWTDNQWVVTDNVLSGGFAFIPFDDTSIGDTAIAVDCSKANYDYVYQYDGGYSYNTNKSFGYTAYMSNRFVAHRDERLKGAGFFIGANENVDYELMLYRDPQNPKSPTSGYHAFVPDEDNTPHRITIKGTTTKAGYYTVQFPQDIILQKDDEFAIVIRLHSDEIIWLPMDTDETIKGADGSILLESESNSFTEQSYISEDMVSWQEISLVGNQNVRIKAFTEDIPVTNDNTRFFAGLFITAILFGGYFLWKYKRFKNNR